MCSGRGPLVGHAFARVPALVCGWDTRAAMSPEHRARTRVERPQALPKLGRPRVADAAAGVHASPAVAGPGAALTAQRVLALQRAGAGNHAIGLAIANVSGRRGATARAATPLLSRVLEPLLLTDRPWADIERERAEAHAAAMAQVVTEEADELDAASDVVIEAVDDSDEEVGAAQTEGPALSPEEQAAAKKREQARAKKKRQQANAKAKKAAAALLTPVVPETAVAPVPPKKTATPAAEPKKKVAAPVEAKKKAPPPQKAAAKPAPKTKAPKKKTRREKEEEAKAEAEKQAKRDAVAKRDAERKAERKAEQAEQERQRATAREALTKSLREVYLPALTSALADVEKTAENQSLRAEVTAYLAKLITFLDTDAKTALPDVHYEWVVNATQLQKRLQAGPPETEEQRAARRFETFKTNVDNVLRREPWSGPFGGELDFQVDKHDQAVRTRILGYYGRDQYVIPFHREKEYAGKTATSAVYYYVTASSHTSGIAYDITAHVWDRDERKGTVCVLHIPHRAW